MLRCILAKVACSFDYVVRVVRKREKKTVWVLFEPEVGV